MIFIIITGVLGSCGTNSGSAEQKMTEIFLVKNGASDYIINYFADYRDIAIQLQNEILDLTGVKLEMIFDAGVHPEREIVIGPNHGDAYEHDPVWDVLYKNDYIVAAYDQRIIIEGGSPTALLRAADAFSGMLSDAVADKNITLTLNDRATRPEGSPFTLAADGISAYKIIRSKGAGAPAILAATHFADEFQQLTGVKLEVIKDEPTPQSEYEILIGNTNRETGIDISTLGYMDYIIKKQDKRLIIVGGSDEATKVAVNRFFAEFGKSDKIKEGNLTADIYDLTYKGNCQPSIMSVMSLNVLNNDTRSSDNTTTAERIPKVQNLITNYMPDLIGVQEFAGEWITGLIPILRKYGYEHIYDQESKVSIIFNKSRIKITEVKSWFYSDTPEVSSITWAEHNRRLLTYAVCELIGTGEKFVFISTHFVVTGTVEGDESRLKAAKILYEKVIALGLPAIAVGDFNCTSASDAYQYLANNMQDSRSIARRTSGPQFTYNGMDGRTLGRIIDFVFTTKDNYYVWQNSILDEKIDGDYYSDHYALYAELELKK